MNKKLRIAKELFRYGPTKFDPEKKTIRLSISSDTPYLRKDWDGEEYWEILDHSPQGMDMTRLEAGTSLLYNHNRDILLGRNMGHECDGHKCYVDSKISMAPDVESFRIKIEEDILKASSVGYEVLDDGQYVGEKDDKPVYKFAWMPYEASLVTIEADTTVGVGRHRRRDFNPDAGVKEICIREKKDVDATRRNENTRTTENHMDEKTPAQIDAEKQAAALKLEEAKAEGAKTERERNASIEALRLHFATKGLAGRKINTSELAAQCIKEGKTVREFQDAVMVGTFKEIEAVVTEGDDPNGDGEKVVTVVGDRPTDPRKRRGLTVGREFVNSKQFREASQRRGQGARNASIDLKDVTMLGASGKSSLIQRAGFTSSDLSAVNIQVLPGMVQLGMQRLTVMDLLTGGATDAAALPYAKENTFGTVNGVAVSANTFPRAQTVGEGGTKPLWLPDLTTDIANVKKVAVVTRVPDEFMADFSGMQSYIDNRLPYMVDLETEFQLLYGSGLGNDLKGIFATAGVQTRAIVTTDDRTIADSLKKGITDVNVYSQFDATGYVFHPFDWETASLLKDSQGRYLAGGPFYIPYAPGVYVEMNTFWGKPVVVTTSCTYGRPLVGAWKLGAQYFIREGMRLETTNSNRDDFENNLIAIRAEHRLALATYRPIAFLEFSGMPARS